jgi:hypothetical protein
MRRAINQWLPFFISGKSASGKKEARLCGTLVRTEGIASRLTAAGIRRYDEMEADGEPPQRGWQESHEERMAMAAT